MSMRSVYCGDVNEQHLEKEVTLCGWVHRRRDLGGLIFIDMRDRAGIVQVYFDPDQKEAHALAAELRNEFCIRVRGIVKARPDNQVNAKMATGAVEVQARELEIINRSAPLPLDAVILTSTALSIPKLRCWASPPRKEPGTTLFPAEFIMASFMRCRSLRSFSSSFL